ncbi:MAG: hypothetical protein ACI9XC_002578 [Gammaproteobacteria bacterium]|jgi:hypothetical protein
MKYRFSLTGNSAGERPVSAVPGLIRVILVISLLSQLFLHGATSKLQIRTEPLPEPLSYNILNLMSIGEPVFLSKLLMFWVQGFDHQPGISIPFAQLDYEILINWLDRILLLDPHSHYVLLSAARIYSEVPDQAKKRQILDFVNKKFLEQPQERWRWMAHAVYVAKHRIKDNELALTYARDLRIHTMPGTIPDWARQMELFVYEELGDLESAQILLGGLIESGEITDESEIRFLMSRFITPTDDN